MDHPRNIDKAGRLVVVQYVSNLVYHGKTVEEAIRHACSKYGVFPEEVREAIDLNPDT